MNVQAPWLKWYGDIPHTLTYPDCSMAELVLTAARQYPDNPALEFFGAKMRYTALAEAVHACARSLAALGVGRGDRVTICMPNTPQAVIMFYAVNLSGAVANMVHPLSAQEELVFYINNSKSTVCLTLDQFYPKFAEILPRLGLRRLILSGIDDGLAALKRPLYRLTKGRGIKKMPTVGKILRYKDFIKMGQSWTGPYTAEMAGDDLAAILYSGGTTGVTKGILLTNRNFNALALQTKAASDCIVPGHKMLAILPIFHGFGLGVCVHLVLTSGACSLLVPQFSVQSYALLLKKHRPNYIVGVPTLFEALLRLKDVSGLDLSHLEGVFSGGDSLSIELKRKVDAFLRERGAPVQIREGYGLTESVTASCLTPKDTHREGSIGIPFPDMLYKIVAPGGQATLPFGETGEICVSGPTVMLGYLDNEAETAAALQRHEDGRIWLHTGDLGYMDADGFLYFRQRRGRVIITSGYSVYPSQIENVIDAHEDVLVSCVIGVPDPYKKQRIKAFIVLRDGVAPDAGTRESILAHCRKNIARYAMPYDLEFRDSLPKTLVGKVAYTVLEQEALEAAAL